jgi:hypothetical protein
MQAKGAASPPLAELHPKRGRAAVRKASLKSGLVKPICCYVASGTPDTGVLGRENPSVSGLSAPSKRSYRRASARGLMPPRNWPRRSSACTSGSPANFVTPGTLKIGSTCFATTTGRVHRREQGRRRPRTICDRFPKPQPRTSGDVFCALPFPRNPFDIEPSYSRDRGRELIEWALRQRAEISRRSLR